MTKETIIHLGTDLSLPHNVTLESLFKKEHGLTEIIEKLSSAARADAMAHDPKTKKGRDGLISLAAKVSKSKAELDRQGKALTEAQRKEIAAVNAGRKFAEDCLAALRDEIRKPVTDWELAEQSRVAAIKDRLAALDADRADANCSPAQIASVMAEINAIETGEDWHEYKHEAEIAKDKALAALRQNLTIAEKREADAAELAALRAEAAAREEADRRRREAEEAEARQIAAEKAEAERLAQIERDKAEAVARAQKEAEERANAEAERLRIEAAQKEAEYKSNIAAEAAKAEAAAKAERARIEDERKAESDARAKREADHAHRARISGEIADALRDMSGNATPELIAAAIMEGKIPHVRAIL